MKKWKEFSLCLVSLLAIAGLQSCDVSRSIEFDYTTFLEQKAAWQNSGVSDYSYEYYLANSKDGVKVVVVANTVVSSTAIEGSPLNTDGRTIDSIYADIEATYLAEKGKTDLFAEQYLESIGIQYSSQHVPTNFHFYYRSFPMSIVNHYSVNNFLVQ